MSNNQSNTLNNLTLILNASYLPLGVCNSKRAICLYFLDKVDILMNYDDRVHSPSMQMRVPSVVKLKKYVSFNSLDIVLNRKNLLMRDHSSCQYCGSKSNLTIDHIIPKQQGGKDSWENLIIACSPCNSRKGNKTPSEAEMKLLKIPKKPNRFMYFNQYINQKNEGWKEYLFQSKN